MAKRTTNEYVTKKELDEAVEKIIKETGATAKMDVKLDANKMLMTGLEQLGYKTPWMWYAAYFTGGFTFAQLLKLVGM